MVVELLPLWCKQCFFEEIYNVFVSGDSSTMGDNPKKSIAMRKNQPKRHYDITAIIELASDMSFSISYERPEGLDFVLAAAGENVAAAKAEFFEMLEDYKRAYEEEGKEWPSLHFTFRYDVASFLNFYSKVFSLAGIARLTGINQRQLSNYLNGHRNASPATTQKIAEAIHNLGRELQQMEFV